MRSKIRNWMRRKNLKPSVIFYLSLVFSFLLFFPSSTSSQEGRIGYVDSKQLIAEFKEFTGAQAILDQENEAWQEEIAQLKTVIDSLRADSAETSLLLSEAKKKEKNDFLASKRLEHKKLVAEIYAPGGRYDKRNEELSKPGLDKINLVLEKIATEENFIMIFDSVNCNIAYAKKSLDLTDLVLEELRKLE